VQADRRLWGVAGPRVPHPDTGPSVQTDDPDVRRKFSCAEVPARKKLAAMTGIAAVAQHFGRDLDDGFARVERTLRAARASGADLVVFPEAALGGYLREPEPGDDLSPDLPPALDPGGPEIRRLIALAGPTTICIGYTEAGPHGPYASAVCVSGDGVLGHQRKVHLPPAERFAYRPGDGFAAFDTPVGRLGMLVCYDKLFPEAARALALDGAQVIACLAAWPADRHHPAPHIADDRQTRHFTLAAAARAVENQVVFASANQTGPWGALRFFGHARVVDPDGRVRAQTAARAGLAVTRLDVAEELERARTHIDHLADRRPSAYGLNIEGIDALPPAITG
jgi:predicted amidohydrolase